MVSLHVAYHMQLYFCVSELVNYDKHAQSIKFEINEHYGRVSLWFVRFVRFVRAANVFLNSEPSEPTLANVFQNEFRSEI